MRILIVFIGINLITFGAYSQGHYKERDTHSKELCLFAGMSYYIGDLNQTGHYYKYQDPAGGIGFRYNLNKRFALRASAWVGKVHADDADSDSRIQRQRNLRFESLIAELSGQVEFNFLPFKVGTEDRFSPYIFIGIGGFHFNPQAKVGSDTYDLRTLSTEGQGTAAKPGSKRYNLTQLSIPFGLGFKWSIGRYIGIGIESGMRKTFTDYIDDVSTTYPDPTALNTPESIFFSDQTLNMDANLSNNGRQRGDSKTSDWYSFTGLILSIRFPAKEVPCLGVQ